MFTLFITSTIFSLYVTATKQTNFQQLCDVTTTKKTRQKHYIEKHTVSCIQCQFYLFRCIFTIPTRTVRFSPQLKLTAIWKYSTTNSWITITHQQFSKISKAYGFQKDYVMQLQRLDPSNFTYDLKLFTPIYVKSTSIYSFFIYFIENHTYYFKRIYDVFFVRF